MYKARVAGVTGIPTTGYFWSSSQNDFNYAWSQDFANGNQGNNGRKNVINNVRAIRAF